MAMIGALCRRDPILCTTEHLTVDVSDDEQVANATDWWTRPTSAGSEGMVVKPVFGARERLFVGPPTVNPIDSGRLPVIVFVEVYWHA